MEKDAKREQTELRTSRLSLTQRLAQKFTKQGAQRQSKWSTQKPAKPSFCQPAALTQLCVKQIWKKVSALCYPHIHHATSHLQGMVNVRPGMHITCKMNTRSLCNCTLTIHRPTFEHMAKRPKKPNPPSAAYRQMQIKSCENLPLGGA